MGMSERGAGSDMAAGGDPVVTVGFEQSADSDIDQICLDMLGTGPLIRQLDPDWIDPTPAGGAHDGATAAPDFQTGAAADRPMYGDADPTFIGFDTPGLIAEYTPAPSEAAADATGSTQARPVFGQVAAASGLTINLVYDSYTLANAPQSFFTGMNTAVAQLEAALYDNITVNIAVGYGEFGGQAISANISEGDIGWTGNNTEGVGTNLSYASLRAALAAHETSMTDSIAVDSLPNSNSLQGRSTFTISTAQAKALGLISPTATAIDGQIGMGTGFTGGVLVAGALHEITHAMGRIAGLGLDLFRYSSPGQHYFGFQIPAAASYFSIDGGTTDLADFGKNSDPGDFLNPPGSNRTANDPYNEIIGNISTLTSIDLTIMDVLGFNVSSSGVKPTVNVQNIQVAENASALAGAIIVSINNPSGDTITQYQFEDLGPGGGHFAVNGLIQTANQPFSVAAGSLSNVTYVGGAGLGSETLQVAVYDATTGSYSNVSSLTATTVLPPPHLGLTAFAPGAGGWSSQELYPRELADVNGDGHSDIVGFGQTGVYVASGRSDGTFSAPGFALSAFSLGPGGGAWSGQDRYPRELADVNGDGRADIIGFGQIGVYVALGHSDGTFAAPAFGLDNFVVGAGGWTGQDLYPRQLADVNGDGRADIVGFGQTGVYVALGRTDGTFSAPAFALTAFAPGPGGWISQNLYPRELADVNGDGRADIVGFGQTGIYVALGRSDGAFAAPTFALNNFAIGAGGWTGQDLYPRELADMNGDGRADIVGFGQTGVYVALGRSDGTFSAPTFELGAFAPGPGGWSSQDAYPRLLGDIGGDHAANIAGFGYSGIYF